MGEVTDLLQVYSHPRSGTNLLCAFIGKNFYPDRDLTGPEGVMGHWTSPVPQDPSPWAYGALFGGHYFYETCRMTGRPIIYIYRDGRDVAVSLWRTKIFLHPDWRELSFSEFLRRKLDWTGSPGSGIWYGQSIAAHWMSHLWSWRHALNMLLGSLNVLLVRFEDLVFDPAWVRDAIAKQFGLRPAPRLVRIKERVGPCPHEGRVGAWREVFTSDDLEYFHESVPRDFWGLHEGYKPKEHWQAKGLRGLIRDRRLTWDAAVTKIKPDVEPELEHLAVILFSLRPTKVLDVGSGWGFIHQYLSRWAFELDYIACDFVDSMIDLHEQATGVRPHKWDGKVLPFDDETFDFVLSYSVLIHVPPPDIAAVLSEHVRVSSRWLYIETAREMSYPARHCFNHDYLALFGRFGLEIVDEFESIDGKRVNWLLRKGAENVFSKGSVHNISVLSGKLL